MDMLTVFTSWRGNQLDKKRDISCDLIQNIASKGIGCY